MYIFNTVYVFLQSDCTTVQLFQRGFISCNTSAHNIKLQLCTIYSKNMVKTFLLKTMHQSGGETLKPSSMEEAGPILAVLDTPRTRNPPKTTGRRVLQATFSGNSSVLLPLLSWSHGNWGGCAAAGGGLESAPLNATEQGVSWAP